jgi:hypothetical protein
MGYKLVHIHPTALAAHKRTFGQQMVDDLRQASAVQLSRQRDGGRGHTD